MRLPLRQCKHEYCLTLKIVTVLKMEAIDIQDAYTLDIFKDLGNIISDSFSDLLHAHQFVIILV